MIQAHDNQNNTLDFEKLSIWEHQQNLDFGGQVILTMLCEKVGQTIDIDLAQMSIDYTKSILQAAQNLNYVFNQSEVLEVVTKIDSRRKKILLEGFKQLQIVGFIRVISSQSWKDHTVEIFPVWEL